VQIHNNMDNRQELKKLLPHGGEKAIAEIANVGIACVSNYFKGHNNSQNVEYATYEYLAKLAEKRRELLTKALS